jgi:predicted PurR-regulated permease PerM
MNHNLLSRGFLIALVLISLIACFLVFRPFLSEILVAAVLATIFYRPFEWLVGKLGGRRKIAAMIMCVLIVLVVIIPLANLIFLAAKESFTAYGQASDFLSKVDWNSIVKNKELSKINFIDLSSSSVQSLVMNTVQKSGNLVMSAAAGLIKGTTNFFVSVIFILLTLFFFFLDGKKMLENLMRLTPLPNKHDREIFKKFQDVSHSFIVSTFVVALCQGFACWIGVFVITLPFFFNTPLPAVFLGIAAAFLSFIPFFGPWLIWLPTSIYLLLTGHVGAAIFLAIWGISVISTIDNIVRPIMMRKKANVNPVFLLFSILGGIALFGIWGIVIGPLVISVTITILHIYELEYKNVLEK